MQKALKTIFPGRCLTCDTIVDERGALCGRCWQATPFISGLVCDQCGAPLIGETNESAVLCDDCMAIARPWSRGRSVFLYSGNARRLVMALKHGDQPELARPAARWMLNAADALLTRNTLIIPIPAFWLRLWQRRYNQAALLAVAMARLGGFDVLPDGLIRQRNTARHVGMTRAKRFANMEDSIAAHPRKAAMIAGRDVLLVDDVMTSGATLAAAATACHTAGARRICTVVLARVAMEP